MHESKEIPSCIVKIFGDENIAKYYLGPNDIKFLQRCTKFVPKNWHELGFIAKNLIGIKAPGNGPLGQNHS